MKLFKFFRNNWIAVWLIIAVCSLISFISYAAYTGTTTAKRVISLSSHEGILFSSRYMSKAGTDMQPILFNYAEGTTPNTAYVMVDICNYDVNSNVYGSNFSYQLKARLVKNNGNEINSSEWAAIATKPQAYKLSYQSVNANTLTSEYTTGLSNAAITLTNEYQYVAGMQQYKFNGSDKTRYLFKAEFDVNDIINANSAYGIEVVAEVVGQHSDLSNISGKLRVIKGGTSTDNTWSGKYMDNTASPKKPADYDGINYQISGNVAGTVRLKYPSDYVEIDKDCYNLLAPSDQESSTETVNYTTLIIPVDPNTKYSMYNIKFYWKNGPISSLAFDDDFIETTFS